jgi:hypothetical protein
MSRCSLLSAGAALWHAIGFVAKLHANRSDLRDDSRYRVDVRVTGNVAGYDVDKTIAGLLTVSGPQTKASSSAVPTAHLVAWLWLQIPASRRADLQAEAVAYFSDREELPGVLENDEDAAKLWLKQLRCSKPKQVDGAVTFAPDPDSDDLAAAERRAA